MYNIYKEIYEVLAKNDLIPRDVDFMTTSKGKDAWIEAAEDAYLNNEDMEDDNPFPCSDYPFGGYDIEPNDIEVEKELCH